MAEHEDDAGSDSRDRRTNARESGQTEECPPTLEERIQHIVDIMDRLEWVRGKTGKILAEKWGLAESTIKNYSAEASRRVVADEDDARRDITAGCRKLFKSAVDNDDAKAARAVGELWASVSGAKAPEKREHKVTGFTLDDINDLKQSTGLDECLTEEKERDS